MRKNTKRLLAATAIFSFSSTLPALAECDPAAGQKVYNKCRACHSLEPGVQLMGPSLHGVLGRPAGAVEGFYYSPAMAKADLVWNAQNLDAFLAEPQTFIPGNVMPFSGLKSQQQRDALLCLFQHNPDSRK